MKFWRSLRVRLVGSYLILTVILLTLFGLVFSAGLSLYAQSLERQRVFAYFAEVRNAMTQLRGTQLTPEQVREQLARQFPEIKVELYVPAPGQVVVVGAPPRGMGPDRVRGDTLFVRDGARGDSGPSTWYDGYEGAAGVRVFRVTVEHAPGLLVRTVLNELLLVLLLAIVLSAAAGWWLSRWLMRPISSLVAATAAAARGDFQQEVTRVEVSELDNLVTQFNRMLRSVRESFRSLSAERDLARRFVVDAAHELKTPLTTMRAYTEVLSERPERLAQALPAVSRQLDRMEHMVADLLEMSNLSEGTALELETEDLGEVVQKLVPWLKDMADEYDQTLTITVTGRPLPVRMDPALMIRVLTNLVENACKYSDPGKRVEVLLGEDGGHAMLTVADQGRGIPADELPYVFDRFHRGIDTQGISGSGLGLAIAREAVQRLGGEISVVSEVGVGSRFTLRLPLAA